jgi:hypothetical protein
MDLCCVGLRISELEDMQYMSLLRCILEMYKQAILGER